MRRAGASLIKTLLGDLASELLWKTWGLGSAEVSPTSQDFLCVSPMSTKTCKYGEHMVVASGEGVGVGKMGAGEEEGGGKAPASSVE